MEHEETREIPSAEQWVPAERNAPPMLNTAERRWEPPEIDRWYETERGVAILGVVVLIALIGIAGIVALSQFPGGNSDGSTAVEALTGSAESSSVPTTPENSINTVDGGSSTSSPEDPTTSEQQADQQSTATPPTTIPATAAPPTTTPTTTLSTSPSPTTATPTTAAPTTTPPTTIAAPTTAAPTTTAGGCHPAYEGCLQNLPGDALNCGDIPASQKPVVLRDVNVDPYKLDGNDRDGRGCES